MFPLAKREQERYLTSAMARPSRPFALAAIVAVQLHLAAAAPALAFKWYECPAPPVPLNPSTLGASGSPFIQPGHALSIYLNEEEVVSTGGFSTAEGGNEIRVTFLSLFGDPVTLNPRSVAAVSPGVLTFDFPDGLAEVGRTLSGPVEIVVETGGSETARISAADLVGIPDSVDLAPLLLGEVSDLIIHATLGSQGDLWIPAYFSGKNMGMPGCEGNFVMPLPMEIGGATVVGDVLFPFDPATRIRRVSGYLGDMVINGTNFYGMLYPQRIQLAQVGDTLGVSVCRLNDSEELVLRIQGSGSWTSSNSPFRVLARDSTPLALNLHKARQIPRASAAARHSKSGIAPGRIDSFGNECLQLPTKNPKSGGQSWRSWR